MAQAPEELPAPKHGCLTRPWWLIKMIDWWLIVCLCDVCLSTGQRDGSPSQVAVWENFGWSAIRTWDADILRYWSWYWYYIWYIIYDIDVISVNIFYTLIKTYLFTEHLCWSCLQTWPWRGKDACEGFFYPSSLDLPKRSSAMASSAIFAICKSANWAETGQPWPILPILVKILPILKNPDQGQIHSMCI